MNGAAQNCRYIRKKFYVKLLRTEQHNKYFTKEQTSGHCGLKTIADVGQILFYLCSIISCRTPHSDATLANDRLVVLNPPLSIGQSFGAKNKFGGHFRLFALKMHLNFIHYLCGSANIAKSNY